MIIVGLVVGAVTLTGWWVRRTAFVTTRTERLAGTILEDPILRDDLARRISDEVATQLATDPITVRRVVDTTLARPEVGALFAPVLGDIHARLIGLRSDPVVIGPDLIAAALGDARAQALPPVSLDIPQISQLDTTRRAIDKNVTRGAVIAVVLVLLGLAIHPWRAAGIGIVGVGLLATAVLLITVGYLVPIRAVPALSDEPWLAVVPDVARTSSPSSSPSRCCWPGPASAAWPVPGCWPDATPSDRSPARPMAAVLGRPQAVTASAKDRNTSTPCATSSSSCMTEMSHCSSSPGGSSTPRLMPHSHWAEREVEVGGLVVPVVAHRLRRPRDASLGTELDGVRGGANAPR